jgi:hypothetical protein
MDNKVWKPFKKGIFVVLHLFLSGLHAWETVDFEVSRRP